LREGNPGITIVRSSRYSGISGSKS